LTYIRKIKINVARGQIKEVVMMTLYEIDGGLSKFGVIPGGGGITPD
jgi:hypothetical protein